MIVTVKSDGFQDRIPQQDSQPDATRHRLRRRNHHFFLEFLLSLKLDVINRCFFTAGNRRRPHSVQCNADEEVRSVA